MTYTVKLETFSGQTYKLELPNKTAVTQFINEYPNALPFGTSVKVACDTLGITGTLRGKASN